MTTTTAPTPPLIPAPSNNPDEIAQQDSTLLFPSFTAQTAWTLGTLLRTRLLEHPSPALIDITLAHSTHCVFRAATHPGTTPDNASWVTRKRNTVLRFGTSTWFLRCKFNGDVDVFRKKNGLGEEYVIHGGGWPVRVRGVEGVVAVVVVSGLRQEEDHGVVVQVVREFLEGEGEEKRKED